MDKASRFGTGYVAEFPHSHGTALLDPAAFDTRVFRHQPRHETPAAFVVAPAFIWKGQDLSSGLAKGTVQGSSYRVFGVYSLDLRTLEMWQTKGLVRDEARVFTHPSDALSYAERRNHETAEQYFSDLASGRLACVDTWKASAVDAFRVVPSPQPSTQSRALAS